MPEAKVAVMRIIKELFKFWLGLKSMVGVARQLSSPTCKIVSQAQMYMYVMECFHEVNEHAKNPDTGSRYDNFSLFFF